MGQEEGPTIRDEIVCNKAQTHVVKTTAASV